MEKQEIRLVRKAKAGASNKNVLKLLHYVGAVLMQENSESDWGWITEKMEGGQKNILCDG